MNKEEMFTWMVLAAVGVAFVVHMWTNLAAG